MPTTKLGKWSVGLTLFFLIVIATSLIIVKGLDLLNFDDRWWDITVAVVVPIELIAFILAIVAMRKSKDRSGLVWLSIVTGTLAILFILLHSLFIKD